VNLVRELLAASVDVRYLSHITGHGLLKLMRPRRELTYTIRRLPDVPEVLAFLAEQADMSLSAAYSTFNMGAGFAVYCAQGSGDQVATIASGLGLKARVAGAVERGPRRVVLEEVGVTFESSDMDLGPSR
jgi:phosphoribosylformylglycinamidine cyclo-ligase